MRREYDAYAVSGRRESGRLINGACSSPSWSPRFCGTPVVEPAMRGSFAPVLSSRIREQLLKLMKPTTQISSNQRKQRKFPLTDYQYQTSAVSADRAVAKGTPAARELENFRKLSTEF